MVVTKERKDFLGYIKLKNNKIFMKVFLIFLFYVSGIFFFLNLEKIIIEYIVISISIISGIIFLLTLKSFVIFKKVLMDFRYSKINITHGWIILVLMLLLFKENLNFLMYIYGVIYILLKIVTNSDISKYS